MNSKGVVSTCLVFLCLSIIPFSISQRVTADSETNDTRCVAEALNRIEIIRSLPQKEYLRTINGQDVRLHEFFVRCRSMFPWCCLYNKFYYWQSEVKTVTSETAKGPVIHKIKSYYNCLSSSCRQNRDPLKTHGDVAEFYDGDGEFMGLGVYMGAGKYCPLPYGGYHEKGVRVF